MDATEAFFIEIQNFWVYGGQIGQINSGAFGIISAKLSVPILAQYIPNIYLGLGFEFELQKIRYLAFVCL